MKERAAAVFGLELDSCEILLCDAAGRVYAFKDDTTIAKIFKAVLRLGHKFLIETASAMAHYVNSDNKSVIS